MKVVRTATTVLWSHLWDGPLGEKGNEEETVGKKEMPQKKKKKNRMYQHLGARKSSPVESWKYHGHSSEEVGSMEKTQPPLDTLPKAERKRKKYPGIFFSCHCLPLTGPC